VIHLLRIEGIKRKPDRREEIQPDFVLKLALPGGEQILVVEVKSNGQPRLAREAVNQLLRNRDTFLAKEYSQCPSSAKGGDLGFFKQCQMVKAFEDAAFALKLGKVSDIVETRFGYHMIKVLDKKPASRIPYEVVKDRLGEYLKQDKVKKEVSLYLEKVKQKAKIERFPE
jgi:parvulin-like peptidyl-prolyl isomerase